MIFFSLAILMISDESDREFMKSLYIKYRMCMFRMARALTDSEQDAEDVVSEACVSLIKATPHNSGKQSKNHRWQQKVQRI